METTDQAVNHALNPSSTGRERMLAHWGEPLFIAGWRRVLMMHLEVDAATLQRDVPFELDLRGGRAFVSLVAFSMGGMRPRMGGRFAAWLFRPIAAHDFLNVRTYVRHNGECGIHFMTEWLSSRLAVMLGPATFGLPYHHARIKFDHNPPAGMIRGRVVDSTGQGKLHYRADGSTVGNFQPCETGSLAEWLMERYVAFNSAGRCRRFFRVWHPPWRQCPVAVTLEEDTLLVRRWPWFREARLAGANYSEGFDEVWMGRPHFAAMRKSSGRLGDSS